jgi:uncharacterized PurR-regulated membrane protein YhhQ (DUF165 family)
VTRAVGLAALVAFVGTVYAANWLIDRYGIVQVGPGLYAPAGVFAIGLAFLLRDVVQRTLGPLVVVVGIAAGAALSFTVSPAFATASAVAFLASELADLAVYTPLERRGLILAVVASNAVGLVLDSALFLWLAFGSLALIEGQIVGKAAMTLAALPLVYLARQRLEVA